MTDEVGKSYTPWVSTSAVTDDDRAIVRSTGSGPAFPAMLAAAMMKHAIEYGLSPEVAVRAINTVIVGAGRLADDLGWLGSCQGYKNRRSSSEAKLDEEDAVAQAVAFSEDGSLLFLAGDRFPQIWDLASSARVLTLSGHEDEIFGGAFGKDGRFILSASGYARSRGMVPDIGNGAHLWDARSGRLIMSYLSAGYVVRTVSFADQGMRLIVGSDDGHVRRYACEVCLPLQELDELVSTRLARGLSDEERKRYVTPSPLLAWIADHMPSSPAP
jgi:hypothetical protein